MEADKPRCIPHSILVSSEVEEARIVWIIRTLWSLASAIFTVSIKQVKQSAPFLVITLWQLT